MSRSNLRAVLRAARALAIATTLAIAPGSLSASLVAAHGELLFQLGAERIQPGGELEVRLDFGSGEAFEIALVSKTDGSRRVIATVAATDEGHFQGYVVVPSDTPAGDYLVEGAYDLIVARAPLTVAGPPITPDDGELPDRDDGFAGPAAGGSPGAVLPQPGATAVPGPAGSPASVRGSRSVVDGLAIVAAAVVAGAGLLVGLRVASTRRARRIASGDTSDG